MPKSKGHNYTDSDLLRQLEAAYGTVKDGDITNPDYVAWLRGWDRYQTLVSLDESERAAILSMVVDMQSVGRGIGACVGLEIVAALCELVQERERIRATAEVVQEFKAAAAAQDIRQMARSIPASSYNIEKLFKFVPME